jgi:hypothetical protein
MLIVCEGTKTEPSYFAAFGVASVDVVGTGRNTRTLVEETKRIKAERDGYDRYWCVFDRDSFPAQNFNAALQMARSDGFEVAYSNEAFELWYLLHFDYWTTAHDRSDYAGKLTKRLGRPYRKNDPTIFETLAPLQAQALRNARRLLNSYQPNHNPEKDNPCTSVHILVEELRGMASEG